MRRAKLTCPKGIRIAKSSIRGSGEGVWTDVTIPKGIVFGPYEGEKVHRQDVQKLKHVYDGGCAWEVLMNNHQLVCRNLKEFGF